MPLPRLLPIALLGLLLTACGDAPGGTAAPVETAGADASAAVPAASPASGALVPRDGPLAVGDAAPSFDGLPDGPVVLVFYRGHW